MLGALAKLIEPDRARLRLAPAETAHLLFMLTLTNTRGFFGSTGTIDSADIVTLLLDGLLVRPTHGEGH